VVEELLHGSWLYKLHVILWIVGTLLLNEICVKLLTSFGVLGGRTKLEPCYMWKGCGQKVRNLIKGLTSTLPS
jgi:hypothetical protein